MLTKIRQKMGKGAKEKSKGRGVKLQSPTAGCSPGLYTQAQLQWGRKETKALRLSKEL